MHIGPVQRQVVCNEISDIHWGYFAHGLVPDVAAQAVNHAGVSTLSALCILLRVQPLAKAQREFAIKNGWFQFGGWLYHKLITDSQFFQRDFLKVEQLPLFMTRSERLW